MIELIQKSQPGHQNDRQEFSYRKTKIYETLNRAVTLNLWAHPRCTRFESRPEHLADILLIFHHFVQANAGLLHRSDQERFFPNSF